MEGNDVNGWSWRPWSWIQLMYVHVFWEDISSVKKAWWEMEQVLTLQQPIFKTMVSLGMKAPPHRSQHKQCMCLARALLWLQGRCLLPELPQTLVPCSWLAAQIWRAAADGTQDLPFGYGLGTQDPFENVKNCPTDWKIFSGSLGTLSCSPRCFLNSQAVCSWWPPALLHQDVSLSILCG